MFSVFEVGRVYNETVRESECIIRRRLHSEAVQGFERPLLNEMAATTYTPGPPDGGLRWSNDRFSYPEGSSNRGGCGRGARGGKDDCEPSGSLEYGELGGNGR